VVSKQTILLTGGAGFIGSHILDRIILKTDWNVIVLEGLNYAASQKRCRFSDRIRYVFHDLRAPIRGYIAGELCKATSVIHCAAESHVAKSRNDPMLFVQSNVVGTANLLDWIRLFRPNLKKYIQMSTVAVSHNLDTARHDPDSPYAATKAAADDLVRAWMKTYRLPATIVHSHNCFGLYQHPEKFIPSTLRKLLDGELVKIYGSPDKQAMHRWVPIRKVCDSIMASLLFEDANEYKEIHGHWATPYQVAAQLAAGCGRRLKFEYTKPGLLPLENSQLVNEELANDLQLLAQMAEQPEVRHWLEV